MSKKISSQDDQAIENFIDSLWSQKGLADLTLKAYQQDLRQFSRWLTPRRHALADADQSSFSNFWHNVFPMAPLLDPMQGYSQL